MILAGDIGGTKTVLALFERSQPEGALRVVRESRFASAEHAGLDDIVQAFLAAGSERHPPTAACFGVAGPVDGGRARITNLPWTIDAGALAARFGLTEVVLLNDLQAAAYGALTLPPESLAVLQSGASGPTTSARSAGTIAVIAPGTGLGEAILYWDGSRHHALASEGGHADFAPMTEREARLLTFLSARHDGHVSWERVLSGAGLGNIYDFLREVEGLDEPAALSARLASGDRNAAISIAALEGTFPIASEALAMFVTLLGAEAGNLALKCFAQGGIVIAGGIPAKIMAALQDGRFVERLHDKGRFGAWLATLPVTVALDPRAPLLGAAHHIATR